MFYRGPPYCVVIVCFICCFRSLLSRASRADTVINTCMNAERLRRWHRLDICVTQPRWQTRTPSQASASAGVLRGVGSRVSFLQKGKKNDVNVGAQPYLVLEPQRSPGEAGDVS